MNDYFRLGGEERPHLDLTFLGRALRRSVLEKGGE